MTITYHRDIIQGSDEWLEQRLGLLTASEVKLIVTPGTLKPAKNEKTRAHLYELLSQRITRHVEPRYVSDDMLRGQDDELEARRLYSEQYAPVTECGFITRTWGHLTIGYSPDGLVGDDGLIECKSRRPKFQVQTFLEWHRGKSVPEEYYLQLQTGLLVTERAWIDLVSYSGGLPMCVMRVLPDDTVMASILSAAFAFEEQLLADWETYRRATEGLPTTKRKVVQEMFV